MQISLNLTKSEFENTYNILEKILSTPIDSIEVDLENPPKIDDLSDSNKSYKITCAILFIDIRKSTDLSDSTQAKSMVKIYRSFMRMTVECVRDCGGVTRQFLGDRIMGIFMDEKDEQGNVVNYAVDKAIYAARCMQTFTDYALNNLIYKYVNKKFITCGIGISYGNVLVTQVGMRGVENDDSKEDERDTVWVGKTTNYASKYADLAQGGEIFIDSNVYKNLSDKFKKNQESQNIWIEVTRAKGDRIFYGYIISNFYVDNIDEFEVPKFDNYSITSNYQNPYDKLFEKVKKHTSDLVIEISKESARLAIKEEELKRKEEELRKKEKELERREREIVSSNIQLSKNNEALYQRNKDILSKTFCKQSIIKETGYQFWAELIDSMFYLARLLGKSPIQVKKDIDCYAINIYIIFEKYDKAYKYLLTQAEYGSWLTYEFETVLKKVKTKYELVSILERRVNNAKDLEEQKKYKEYLDKVNMVSIY
jgi:adenylate cyclase